MKKIIWTVFIIIAIVIGFYIGTYIYKAKIENNNSEVIAEKIEDDCTEIGKLIKNGELDIVETNNEEEKVSPNCEVIFKIYYQDCGHIIEKKETIKEADVNLTEDELKEKFPEWELQKFTSKEIILYKEVSQFCNEHYMLKEDNGYIALYQIDKENNEKLIKVTDIPTIYLEYSEQEKIKDGIMVYTKKELSKTVEDYE